MLRHVIVSVYFLLSTFVLAGFLFFRVSYTLLFVGLLVVLGPLYWQVYVVMKREDSDGRDEAGRLRDGSGVLGIAAKK